MFSVMSTNFYQPGNINNIINQVAIYGIMAIGMTLLLISGNIDLSIGSVMALSAAIVIILQPYSISLAIIVALLAGALIGVINGLLVSKAALNSFIVTLAMMMGVRGVVYIITKEKSIIGVNLEFTEFISANVANIPLVAFIFLILFLVAHFVLKHTSHGRNAYAVGGNQEAAKHAGIKVERHILMNFIISALMAAVAGILVAGRINSVTPNLGTNYELLVITMVLLGGTKFTGGYGSMIHTLGGILFVGILSNGLNQLNVQSFYNTLIVGLMLLVVIYFDKHVNINKSGGKLLRPT